MQVKNEIRVRVCWKCMIIDTLVSKKKKKKEKKKNKHGQTLKNWERKSLLRMICHFEEFPVK